MKEKTIKGLVEIRTHLSGVMCEGETSNTLDRGQANKLFKAENHILDIISELLDTNPTSPETCGACNGDWHNYECLEG